MNEQQQKSLNRLVDRINVLRKEASNFRKEASKMPYEDAVNTNFFAYANTERAYGIMEAINELAGCHPVYNKPEDTYLHFVTDTRTEESVTNFREYVDDLAKRGVIDGHIAQMLVSKHDAEVENPSKAIRDKVDPILDIMWSRRTFEPNVAEYADSIDDAIEAAAGKEG